jgi:DNA helicase-2/ATP-dependent DNA helicase PcrA
MEQINMGRSAKDMAVLFRAAYHSFELELELTRQGIPFVKYGGFKFMESAHIKDLLAHLRVVLNRDDTLSWGRILRLIKNIGQRKSQAIMNWMRESHCLPWQMNEWPEAGKGDEGLKTLSQLMKELSTGEISPDKAVELVTKYYDPIIRERFDDFPKRQKDLEQLVPMARRYRKLRAFLDDLIMEPPTSLADMDPKRRGECLTLSTVHSAKGLEWPVVMIIWVMEGYFPSARAYANLAATEEERRLMYVAATRAKDQLILCYPGQESRPGWSVYGMAEAGYRSCLSSFIQALPEGVTAYGSSRPSHMETRIQWPSREARIDQNDKDQSQDLRPGDRVNHPAFGQGVISRFMDGEKVEVLFRDWGRKLLHLGYTSLDKM